MANSQPTSSLNISINDGETLSSISNCNVADRFQNERANQSQFPSPFLFSAGLPFQALHPTVRTTISETSFFHPSDVLSGKGRIAYHHIGNYRFRKIVASVIEAYINAGSSRSRKAIVVKHVVQEVANGGGRFLKRDEFSGKWIELEAREIKDKVSHAIRDAAATLSERRKYGKKLFPALKRKGSREASLLLSNSNKDDVHSDRRNAVDLEHESGFDPRGGSTTVKKDIEFNPFQERQHENKNHGTEENDFFLSFIDKTLGPLEETMLALRCPRATVCGKSNNGYI